MDNAAPAWNDADRWRVEPEPTVSIGSIDGTDAYVLFRVAGTLRMPDGRIAVANGGTREVRFYDAAGIHLSSVGGTGSGPGEFRDIGVFAPYRGDSLLVFDRSEQRVTVLDGRGRLGRVARLAPTASGAFPSVRASLADGRFVARSTEIGTTADPWRLWRDTILIARFDADGAAPEALARLPGSDRYTIETADGYLSVNNHPMGRIPEMAADGNLIYYLDGGELGVDIYSGDGALLRRIRTQYVRTPVTDDVVAELETLWLGDSPTPADRRFVDRTLTQMELPEVLPSATGLLVDPDGGVWVSEYSIRPARADSWQVFDAEGRWLGAVRMPPGFRVMQVGADFVLGVTQDELEVERVQLFRLIKPG